MSGAKFKLNELYGLMDFEMKDKDGKVTRPEGALLKLRHQDLEGKTPFRLKTLCSNLEPILKNIESVRQDLIKKYGEKDEKGDTGIKDPEKIKLFYEDFNKALEDEIDVEFLPLDLTGSGYKLNEFDIERLEKFLDENFLKSMNE